MDAIITALLTYWGPLGVIVGGIGYLLLEHIKAKNEDIKTVTNINTAPNPNTAKIENILNTMNKNIESVTISKKSID